MQMGRTYNRRRGPILVVLLLGFLAVLTPTVKAEAQSAEVGLAAVQNGRWYLYEPGAEFPSARFSFGTPWHQPLLGDWDCDGIDTVGSFGGGRVSLRNTNTAGTEDLAFFFGQPTDIALAGDWDGDGCDSIGAYRPTQGLVFLRNDLTTGPADETYYFGEPGDRPFAADFNGAGFDSVGLYREATGLVYLRESHTTGVADFDFFYGEPDDQFIGGDWDGDGVETVGIVRSSDRSVYLRNQNTQGVADSTYPLATSGFTILSGRFEPVGTPDRTLVPLLPTNRVVAYYGNHLVPAMGVLGETGPIDAVARVQAAAAPYSRPGRPAVGAFEMIVTVAQARPGSDGNYSAPSDPAELRPWLDAARDAGIEVIFDIQPGRANFLPEVQYYEELLKEPHVHLALDPEWRMSPTGIPGQGVGQVDASEVNAVARWLSDLVVANDLPDKMLIVHQFQTRMITNRDQLETHPGLIHIIHMDGFGGQRIKLQTYSYVHAEPPFFNGFKLFYDEDTNIFQPDGLLQISPVPDLITYQ